MGARRAKGARTSKGARERGEDFEIKTDENWTFRMLGGIHDKYHVRQRNSTVIVNY